MADAHRLSKESMYLFNTGNAREAYRDFGCHYFEDIDSWRFSVWAPNALCVSVTGDFNGWDTKADVMENTDGVWTAFVSGSKAGDNYKYAIVGRDGRLTYKADPFAVHGEVRPKNASKVWEAGGYEWGDGEYMQRRSKRDVYSEPMSVYELHLGSWRVPPYYDFASVRETAEELARYVTEMGYTHVELLPIMEHPLDGSWGYQVTGYYAPTSRYGTPQDYMYFVDVMHKNGIGVILDWVPAHFPKDEHGLGRFDGSCLFEYEDPRKAESPDWGTFIFDYGKPQVVSFLMSSLFYWIDMYHVDGFRFDAVSSMLYLDYGRENGEYIPNQYGGNTNLEAIGFLKKVNAEISAERKGVITIAEEATAYPMVTAPPKDGGLGFSFKWNMGHMNDTLEYFRLEPCFRAKCQTLLTFAMMYASAEHFILPYSHDEVVHGKKSMVDKIPEDYWRKFATLRAQYGYLFAHPGKKLLFMGNDFAQFIEWDEKRELDWFLLEYDSHRSMLEYVRRLNHIYTGSPELYEIEEGREGFCWLDETGGEKTSLSFMRTSRDREGERSYTVCVFNFTPDVVYSYPIGLPYGGVLREILNSDDKVFGGSGVMNEPEIWTEYTEGPRGLPCRARVTLPPLAAVYFKFERQQDGILKEINRSEGN